MATTPTGVTVPAGTDVFDPDGDMRDLATSLEGRIIVPVPNTAARDALAAALAPSATEPLYVHRHDAPAGGRLEVTIDGLTWRSIWSAPPGEARAGGAMQRSDGSTTINAGATDLRIDPASITALPAGAGTVWSGSGLAHDRPGLWWAHATLRTSAGGARWIQISPAALKGDITPLGSMSTDDTASTGFGTATWSGFLHCPTGPGLRMTVSSNIAGTIRTGSSLDLVWIRP